MEERVESDKALNPTVKRLGFISFLADISSEMLYPITPIFMTTVLGASVSSLGFIEGVAEATASLLKVYSGTWSDRIQKRKPFIWVGYLLAALAKPLTGISQVWTHVLFARAFDRTGKGLRTAPRDALLAESVPMQYRGAAFGWHRLMNTMGAATGPLLAILFLQYFENLRWMFFLAFIPGMLAVIVAMGIKEEVSPQIGIQENHNNWGSFFKLPKTYRHYLFSWILFSLANSGDVFLLLRVKQVGVSLTETILLYCFYNLVYALSSPYLGSLSDRFGRKLVLLFGLASFTFVYTGFIFATTVWHCWVLFAIYGLFMAATEGVGKALAIDLLAKNMKATAVGYLGMATGISTLIGSSLAGILWDQYGSTATFGLGAGGAALAFAALLSVPIKNSAES